jgi:hypothetical protein
MHFHIDDHKGYGGYTLERNAKVGDIINVKHSEFLTLEDGAGFAVASELILDHFLRLANPPLQFPPGCIDSMLVIFNKKSADVYINEVTVELTLTKRAGSAPGSNNINDIVDVKSARFRNVEVPNDTGIIWYFHIKYRQGLYYNLMPSLSKQTGLNEDLNQTLAACYSRLLFEDIFRLTDIEWGEFFSQGWFPFIAIGNGMMSDLINIASIRAPIDRLTTKISEDLNLRIDAIADYSIMSPAMRPQIETVKKAILEYKHGNYAKACTYSQLAMTEAIINFYKTSANKIPQSTQVDRTSVVFPLRFAHYTLNVLLPNLEALHEPQKNNDDLLKLATIGILSIEHMHYCIPPIITQQVHETINSSDALRSLLHDVETKIDKNEKGRSLEELLCLLFDGCNDFQIIARRMITETEEIDIEVLNQSKDARFCREAAIILVEAKNWTARCGKNELVQFISKIENRRGRSTIGIFVSWNGFAETFERELIRGSRGDILILMIDGTQIREAVAQNNFKPIIDRCFDKAVNQ